MQLTPDQVQRYQEDGFIVIRNLFDAGELAAMRAELERLDSVETDHTVREDAPGDGANGGRGAVKTIFRVHEPDGPTRSPPFFAATRSPRLLGITQQLAGDEQLYVHHTKCNRKAAISGTVWQWHQDYGYWQRDGMRRPDLITAGLMLDPATEANGCLYFIPGSHKLGRLEPVWDEQTAYKLWVVPRPKLLDIMSSHPAPVAITGVPGDVVFFHCNLLHGSGHNLSAGDRWTIFFCYNRCANRPEDVSDPRPDYVRSRNWAPLDVQELPISLPVTM